MLPSPLLCWKLVRNKRVRIHLPCQIFCYSKQSNQEEIQQNMFFLKKNKHIFKWNNTYLVVCLSEFHVTQWLLRKALDNSSTMRRLVLIAALMLSATAAPATKSRSWRQRRNGGWEFSKRGRSSLQTHSLSSWQYDTNTSNSWKMFKFCVWLYRAQLFQ